MTTSTVEYVAGSELPPMVVQFLANDNTTVIDLTGFTFTLKVALDTTSTVLTKTSGITGSTLGATVNWTAGELALPGGTYLFELRASSGTLDYARQGTLIIRPALA